MVLLLIAGLFLLALVLSCGDANNEAIFDPDTGTHIERWLTSHGQTVRAGRDDCTACHGADLSGGNAGVSCSSQSFDGTACHGSIGFHPQGWETAHALEARVSTTTCSAALCHGADFRGGGAGVACFDCHLGGPVPSDPVTGVQIMHPEGEGWCDSQAPQCDENDTPQKRHDEFLEARGKDATGCAPTRSGVAQYCHGDGLLQGAFINSPPFGSWPDGFTCFICHDTKEWTAP
jgi:hypothetical protein